MKIFFLLPLMLVMMSLGSLYAQTYVVVSAVDGSHIMLSNGSGTTIKTYCADIDKTLPYVGFTYTFDGTYYNPSDSFYQRTREYACTATVDYFPTISACNPSTNTYSVSGYVSFVSPPSTGTLTISDGSVSQTFYPPFPTSLQYNLTGITADGGSHTVYASFSATNCTGYTLYRAPASCSTSPCSIGTLTATPSACNSSTNTYSTSGYVYLGNPPSSGTLTVSDGTASQTFYAPFTSPLAYTLTGISANGSTHSVNASFSAASCSNTTYYTAPASCAVSACSISFVTATPSACNSSTNTYSTSGYVYFSNPPSSGTLIVSDGTASQTLYPPFTSPLAYTLTGISANGSTHTVNASFSGSSCANSSTYTAPASCAVSACSISSLTASPSACNSSTNTYSTSGYVYFSNPPSSGTLTVSDGTASQTFYAPFTSPLSYTLTGITANGSTHTVSASFSAASCSKTTTYTAPASCSTISCTVSLTAIPGTCNPSTNTYSVSGRATIFNAPGGSLITFTDGTTSQSYTVPSSGVSTTWVDYTLSNFTSNGTTHTVYAVVSNGASCSGNVSYTAPTSCLCTNPTPTVNSPSICAGSSATLTVSNCAGTVTWSDGMSGAVRTVSPSFTTSYTATCTVGTCTGTATATVTVTSNPTPTPTVNSPSICAGSSATLTVSNCAGTVTWSDGMSGATRTVSPSFTTSYTVTCTVSSGSCTGTGTATATVTVTSNPTPTPTVNSPSICAGSSATLTVSNCAGTVTWSDGMSGATRTVSPSFTTSYTATCTVSSGSCTGTGTATATVTVTPKPTPTPTVNSPSICAGSSATLTVSNCAGTVTWSDGMSGLTKTVSPSFTTSYTATCTVSSGSCTGTGTATATVTVTSNPTPTPTVNSPSICAGSSATLTVSNCAGTVTWSDGMSGATRTVSPSFTTSYTATCTVSSGSCTGTGTATATVTVTPKPTPTPTVNSPSICAGSSATLTVSNCAGTVTWSDGMSGATRTVSPSFTTSYTATCTASSGSCTGTGTATATVTVTPKPTPTPTVNSPSICAGSSATLTVSNCAGTVTWSDGTSGLTKTVSPTVTTSYTATCTVSSGSCTGTGTATATVTVTPKPTPTPTVNSPSICAGSSATLTVSNCAGTVTWSDGTSGLTKTVSPTVTTSYTATCTVSSGSCTGTGTATATVTVTPKPTPTPTVNSPSICAGSSATLTVSNCAGTVTWSDGTSGLTKTVSPTVTTSYTATCTVSSGSCTGTGTATATVTVTPKPTPTPTVNSPSICAGSSATLTVSNCAGTVTWSDGTSGLTKTVSPTVTTSYTATCTVSSGSCTGTGTATATVTVNPQPTITINTSAITCSADLTTYSLSFTATTGATVTADKGTVTGTTVSGIPSGQTVTLTALLNGCSSTASATKVCSCPTINPPVGTSKEYCEGDAIPALTVTVDAGLQADWYNVASGGTKLASGLSYTPTIAQGDFYVEAINTVSACKSATRTKVSLVMNAKPSISTQTTCAADGLTYSVAVTTNATSISADKGTVSGMNVTGIPSGQTVTITATSAKGCKTTTTASQSCTAPVFDLALKKTLATGQSANVVAGGTVKFTISIINQGNVDATNVQVSDYIPTGLTLNDANWTASGSTATMNTMIASLPAGQTVTRDISFTVGSGVTGTITNFAEISAASNAQNLTDIDSTPDANATNDGTPKNDIVNENGKTGGDEDDHDPESITVTPAPVFDLALKKTLATGQSANVVAGGTVKFTISIINQGNVDATNVQVSDYIPTGLTLNDANWTASGSTATMNTMIASLPAGQTVTRDITFTVGSGVTGTITNFAEISAANNAQNLTDIDSTPDANATNDGTPKNDIVNENGKTGGDEDDHDPESITVTPAPVFDLALKKTLATGQSANVVAGGVVKFTISIINQGNVDATNVQVSDYIPTGLTLNDANWTASGSTATMNTMIASLPAGQTVTRDISFTVGSGVTGTITNFAEISSASNAQNLTDIDSTPDNNPSNDGTPKNDVVNENGKTGGDEDDHDPESITVTPAPVFDLALKKTLATGQSANVVAGGTVKFTISIINQGNVDATNVQVSDYIPTGLTLNDANWTASGSTATMNTMIASLPAGQTVTRDITFTVGSGVTGTITNFAEISAASNAQNLTDIDSTPDANATNDGTPKNDIVNENGKTGGDEDDHDPESITVTPAPVFDLALKKTLATGQSANVVAGGTVKFTISIINQGNVDATNVQVSDYIPTGLTLNDANWTASGSTATMNTMIASLPAGQTVTRDITFTVGSSVTGTITNFAEISAASNAQNLTDIDSTPDANATNDGTPKNDIVNENGKTGGDEDDHDPESITVTPAPVFDLALKKTLATGQSANVVAGGTVKFTISIINQGNVDATNVQVSDYIPTGLTLNDANWTASGSTATMNTMIASLPAGQTVTRDIAFIVGSGVTGTITNFAEISAASNAQNLTDIDSTPDNNSSNDGTPKNDVVNENGKTGGDEDDHDPESISVTPPVCITPSAKAYGVAATCSNGLVNNDAKIVVYNITNGTKVGYSLGFAYTGPNYNSATPVVGTNVAFTGLQGSSINGTKYTIRVYNGNDACYIDFMVIVPYTDCNTNCTVDAGADQLLCQPISSIDLKDATATQEWVEGSNNPVTTTINASTGLVSGISANGIYSYILREKNNPNCSDIVYVFRSVMDLPSVSTCETSYQLPTLSGVTWSVVSGSASVTPSGLVTGMNTAGVYQFSANFNGCISTVDVVKVGTCTCQKPDAGADVNVCLPKTTIDLVDAASGYTWLAQANNPSSATIHATTGAVSNLTTAGTYRFILQSTTDNTCADTVQVVVNAATPIILCNDGSSSYNLVAPSTVSNVVWYNMAGVQVGTGATLIVKSTTAGLEDGNEAYYYKGTDTATATQTEMLCPASFITQVCCIEQKCIQINTIKMN